MKNVVPLFIIFFLLIRIPVNAQLTLDLETGLAFQGYNDVRIPNETGTEFNFNGDFELQGPVVPLRIRLGFTFNERNHLFALFAPLGLNYEGPAPFDIRFQNTDFNQGEFIEGFYKFNSYRLTYRRDFFVSERWTLGAGFTAKIRDARVQLTAGEKTDKKDDLGFVPLLNLSAAYQLDGFTIWFEGDGLAGGPGRAFDLFLGGKFAVLENLHLKGGYRFLEGGADVSDVYNFTLVNFAILGILWQIN
jgi:hypothetical protein